jgi:hypothetical protein
MPEKNTIVGLTMYILRVAMTRYEDAIKSHSRTSDVDSIYVHSQQDIPLHC